MRCCREEETESGGEGREGMVNKPGSLLDRKEQEQLNIAGSTLPGLYGKRNVRCCCLERVEKGSSGPRGLK